MEPDQQKAFRENAEQIGQQKALRENAAVLKHFGWRQYKDGEGQTWFVSEETKQWSRTFPLFAILSNDDKQELHRLLGVQPAPRPSSSTNSSPS